VNMAKPQSIQQPPAYLTRHVFRFVDPTGFSADQWRLIAREPVNRMAQRFIVRELSALQWTITSDRRDDPRVDEYTERWDEIFEDGDGFATWLSRMLEDACSLPFGGASEIGYTGEDLAWALHVDAATLYPTYERRVPYVQVNPDDATQRVYFKRGQLRRLRVNPRPDIRFKEYQVSPTEDGFLPIEALSKIYLYYMQQLLDTPPMGFLDVPGWDEDDAKDWAHGFWEMIEGIDPIKIPIIYDHKEGPANWIPFGRTPSDLNIPEQFKRFAEMLLGKYGLSIGDLRLFEHESTKAGERVSQLVTERSGVGFWAALIAAFINHLLPAGLTFEFKQPRPERELTVANRKMVQMTMLREAAGGKALISVKDAVEEARALELFQTEVKPLDEDQAPPPPFGGNGKQGPPELPSGRPEEELDQEADQDLAKAFIEKQLGRWRNPEPPAAERLAALVRGAFERSAENVDAGQVGEIAETIERTLELLKEVEAEVTASGQAEVEKGGPGSGHWGHAGRPGARGGSASASRGVQAGITSYKEGERTDIHQIRAEMRQFRARLTAIPGVRNVSVEEGRGAWPERDEEDRITGVGGEPTWVTRYEGNGEALALMAETGKRYHQDAVLVMRFVGKDHPNAQPFDQISFGARMDTKTMQVVEKTMIAKGLEGWTWSQDARGNSALQVACVPQWGGEAHVHTGAMGNVVRILSDAGIAARTSRLHIDPLVLDASNYDDFIQQGR
jgi:hypothetical protein